jgi:beta-glucosidase
VEGNNVHSDLWLLEHMQPTVFAEPSGDACDHYHRYREDIQILANLGLNTYRFSIEWARIEPEPGFFSNAALEHYRRMLAACQEFGVTPMVTFHHFSAPRWFSTLGGWEDARAGDLFVRYCERAARRLGDLIAFAATFNEPNLPLLLRWVADPGVAPKVLRQMMKRAARAVRSRRLRPFLIGNAEKSQEVMIAAHYRAMAAIKSGPGRYPVGVTLSIQEEQAAGPKSRRDQKCAQVYDRWLAAAAQSDFLGVQTYTRSRVGKDRDLGPEPAMELTQMGYEFWPEALEATVRYARARVNVPIYITENGVSTEDDSRRVEYIGRALEALAHCLQDRIDVRGYIYWSLLDNFEWISGYRPKFGLVAVNRETQERTLKPSGRYLGEIAKRNAISLQRFAVSSSADD